MWSTPAIVWDPITNVETELPSLPEAKNCHGFNGSVLCGNTNTCDHLDCNGGPFLVILMVTKALDIFVYTYSSETSVWSELASGRHVGIDLTQYLIGPKGPS
ncbi:hypothetical protein EJB05_13951, partial [Eragrostis curvula]